MNHFEPLQEERPLLGYTVDEVISAWQQICDKFAASTQRIRAFVGQREFRWHQGKIMRVTAEQHLRDAGDEEIADLHRSIRLGSFLVVRYTGDEPVVLHQVGTPLPQKMWAEESAPPIQRHLPLAYRMLLALPRGTRRPCTWAIVQLALLGHGHDPRSAMKRERMATALALLVPSVLVGILSFRFTGNVALSFILGEVTVPLAAIVRHRITTGTWGTKSLPVKPS